MTIDPATLDEREALARTIFAEASGEGFAGMMAVGLVIMNRQLAKATWWGKTIKEICLKSSAKGVHQFSCWNEGDPNRARITVEEMPDSYEWSVCLFIADLILEDLADRPGPQQLYDFTAGSCHYHTKAVHPRWSRGHAPALELGAHVFFNDIA